MNTTYILLTSKINKGLYQTQEEMQTMLDVFYIGNRITQEQYEELTALVVARHPQVITNQNAQ